MIDKMIVDVKVNNISKTCNPSKYVIHVAWIPLEGWPKRRGSKNAKIFCYYCNMTYNAIHISNKVKWNTHQEFLHAHVDHESQWP